MGIVKTKGIATSAVVAIILIIAIAGIGGYFVLKEGIREGELPPTIPAPSEPEESYKASCRADISFEQLNTNPYTYMGQRVTYQGVVLSVLEYTYVGETHYRIDVDSGDTIWVTFGGITDILEDDAVQIWGEVLGSHTYTSIAGWKITLPLIGAVYVEKVSFELKLGETARWIGLEVTVLSAEEVPYYTWYGATGREYTEWADTGKVFVIIDTEIKYLGTGSEYVYAEDFWLIDSGGHKYEYDSGTYSLEGGLEGVTLYQNQRTEGKVLFEIPEDATGLKVQFNLGTSWEPILVTWSYS